MPKWPDSTNWLSEKPGGIHTGNAEVFLHHLDGSPETQVTDDPGWDVSPAWSPDGRQLIFSSSR